MPILRVTKSEQEYRKPSKNLMLSEERLDKYNRLTRETLLLMPAPKIR